MSAYGGTKAPIEKDTVVPQISAQDQTQLHTDDTGGDGRPVVLIHG